MAMFYMLVMSCLLRILGGHRRGVVSSLISVVVNVTLPTMNSGYSLFYAILAHLM